MPRRPTHTPQSGSNYAFDPRLDLNLFRVLDAIYTHDGISGAARVLHLTQPAISHALRRLREVFNDPLFVRSGNRMVPTDLTRSVMADIRGHLQGLFGSIHAAGDFEPAALQTEFRIALRDVAEATALPVLMGRLHQVAPDVRVVCREVARENFERELANGGLDFVMDRRFAASPDLRCVHMGHEQVAIVAATERFPQQQQRIGSKEYLRARHAVVTHLEGRDPIDSILAESGASRHVVLRCAHYLSACRVVAQSDLLLTMPRRYAEELAALMPLRVFDTPIPIAPIQVYLYWHRVRDDDRVHRWMRDEMFALSENGRALAKA
ncbi:LysR family transcriptional regulator [Curvibacter sp. APW13]|uniref:LysR family transcriptional regulator n=1 Tax=Curvibacter sp. APW13 TaxID=3077236 RepID=UPI0028E0672B|nr:LysR family transcriptional regulator [Curvibacter sp. APW13]MDT8991493.1 LysR family transcriptional regulator [Curvibacter sp. APW13]